MPICNGCGEDKPTSDEHLIQADVARAIIGDPALTAKQARDRLPTIVGGSLVGFDAREAREHDLRGKLRGLLCRDCNSGWAGRLDKRAGRHILDFQSVDAPLDSLLMHRWLAFFHFKLFTYYRPPPGMRSGDLLPVLRSAAIGDDLDPSASPNVYLARLPGPVERWQFHWCTSARRDDAGTLVRFAMAIRGVLWLLSISVNRDDVGRIERSLVAGEDGLRFRDLPVAAEDITSQLGLLTGKPFCASFLLPGRASVRPDAEFSYRVA